MAADGSTAGFAFDEATALDGAGPVFGATLPAEWGHEIVNGGFMLSLLTRAMGRIAPFPDPIVVSGFYLRPGSPGPVEVRTELIRTGRTTAFTGASLWRDGKESVRATAAFTDLDKPGDQSRPPFTIGAAPQLPPPEECASAPEVPRISMTRRMEYRFAQPPGWLRGQRSGDPSLEFYMRFRDGREPDMTSLPLFVDAAAPAVFEAGVERVTTIELTAHLRARPAPGWLSCRSRTRFLTSGGYHEEDFEIWDSAGTLVAQSRQLALVIG
jgi:acyl-coenzyme A thioesterase PaaI-like protein